MTRTSVALVAPLLALTSLLPVQAHAQRSPTDSAAVLMQAGRQAYEQRSQESLEQSIQLFQQAILQLRGAKDRHSEGNVRNTIGSAYRDLSRADSAQSYYLQALAIRREVGDRSGEATTLSNLGSIHYDLGRADSALVYYGWALAIRRELGDGPGQGATLTNVGSVHQALGRADSALVYLAQALAIWRRTGDSRGEGAALQIIGSVHQGLGRTDSAEVYYGRALALRRELGDRPGEGATLNQLGSVQQVLGRGDSALTHLAGALALLRQAGDRRGEGTTLHIIGSVHQAQGRPDSALAYYAQALAIRREVGDRRGEGATLSHIGVVHGEQGRADSALVYYAQALPILREVEDRRGEGTVLVNTGYLYHHVPALRDLARAVAYYDSAAAVIGDVGRSAGGDQNRLSFAEHDVALFHMWAHAWLARAPELGEPGAASAALVASERGRAQALRELMRRNSTDSGAAGAGAAPTLGGDLPAEGRALAQSLARRRITAVSYLVTEETLYAFLVRPGREVEVFDTPVDRDTLAALVSSVRARLGVDSADSRARAGLRQVPGIEVRAAAPRDAEDENAWQAPAARLSALLLPAALRAKLPASGELVIVAAGPLFLLPFAALPLPPEGAGATQPESFLGLRYALRYAPSLQVLADLEAQPGNRRPTSEALVVGNPAMPSVPVGDRSFLLPALEGAEAEGGWVAGRVGASLLTGGAASEAAVRARLGTATLVHLATHAQAYASDARARDSFIALAPGDGEDGLLTVGEVLDGVAPMRAELVVLSACQTGLGDLKQAEGTVGLQRAFFARGARGVLATLWSVSDKATEQLMEHFYTNWLGGRTKAEALWLAQVQMARDPAFSHPRYWAAFQMVGAR